MIAESENKSTEFSAENINGVYRNKIGDNGKTGLWNILADNKTFKGDTTAATKNSFVKVELISNTELKASLIENDSITKSMLFDGEIVDNYFSIKKKMILVPIPALFFHRERKTILGNNKNGNLNLTRGYKNGAWFIFMAGDYGGISNYEFERIKN
ncbi:hypothetical protein [Lacinutrix sp. MedPE-SW]|uniref:hypothetical protein n=1 Tax=Lacinutrix sp. MedPE-SW TaxID=1860087 RepID=UPI00091EA320|nr:hypothetical protein [Lacinutrix sp. MedPE-SW]OIQ22365.1 MAG: hypothetical protein BM549_07680 [Lacinutrix sp. MedPE-SW]